MTSVNATPDSGRLREQRRAAGLSQQRLAELAGCSLSAVRLFERGYHPARSVVLARIQETLNDPPTQRTQGGNPGLAKTAGLATDAKPYS